ncbi:MAG TPA: LapA family protein [Solimonas sp.]|nr:LapA family protein [Solimonas sp.]
MTFKLPRSLLFFLVILPVFVLGTTIGFFNGQDVEFNYLFGSVHLPLIALLIGEFLLVVALTLLATLVRVLALKSEIRRLRKQLRDADTELKNLRVLSAPVAASALPNSLPRTP